MDEKRPLTTRRSVIGALGFGAVSLYGLWVAYGAAPSPLAALRRAEAAGHDGGHGAPSAQADAHAAAAEPEAVAGHAGHGAALGDIEAFRQQAEGFAERYRMPDGSVYPRRPPALVAVAMDHGAHGAHGDTAMATAADQAGATHGGAETAPLDVYLMAFQWGYTPDVLRLDAGKPYRFRMMAADVTHGASIQLGRASRIIRLRPGTVSEQTVTFRQSGEYLVYCSVYCGMAHDSMMGRIVVA